MVSWFVTLNDQRVRFKADGLVKSPHCCHCEERSDAAISIYQADMKCEIASLRSQRRLLGLFTNSSNIALFKMAGNRRIGVPIIFILKNDAYKGW